MQGRRWSPLMSPGKMPCWHNHMAGLCMATSHKTQRPQYLQHLITLNFDLQTSDSHQCRMLPCCAPPAPSCHQTQLLSWVPCATALHSQ